MTRQIIYQLENVTRSYGGTIALAIPELRFYQGETCALVGPNGSGKTTLLRLLALIDRPTSGRLLFDSVPLWNGSGRHIQFSRRITMVSNPPYLFNRSVAYNIGYGLRVRGASRKHVREKIQEVLNLAGLEGFERREARKLSSGEQQRVALGRALALEPDVLLLDEPTASIDREHTKEIESFIEKVGAQKSMTIVFSTHNQHQADSLAQRVIPLYEGRVEDFIYENLYAGVIVDDKGTHRITLNSTTGFEVSASALGVAQVSIDPRDIIISRQALNSPGANCLPAKLTGMSMHDSSVKLLLDAGVPLTVILSHELHRQFGPKLGENLYCIFDATAVRIIKNDKNA
ncbi:MAG: ATP-binding cassette domain-containing protein [Candidatus Abyssobacteria bacterium SURF_5]|uniref:ATP-binding cassette domain-containing protein n=1 Tax=Abyssobacteria bacterium (strain SURF_5) TaxID=2093360 RepID=A0A3A4PDN2_ABYX5|nr:MAG: ATP-binding cassette domain-containing protein [Candidatus Abyssubacteria bacterium SURF_5]